MRMLGLVALAMGADLVTFALIVPLVGGDAESNPIMRRAFMEYGLVAVALLKFACTVAVLLLIARVRRHRWIAATVGVGFGLFGAAGNIAAWARR